MKLKFKIRQIGYSDTHNPRIYCNGERAKLKTEGESTKRIYIREIEDEVRFATLVVRLLLLHNRRKR